MNIDVQAQSIESKNDLQQAPIPTSGLLGGPRTLVIIAGTSTFSLLGYTLNIALFTF